MPRHLNYQEAIKESAESLLELENQQTKAFIRDRIRFLRLLKSGECSSQQIAGMHIGISLRESQRVWKQYKDGGLKALMYYPYQGQPIRLSDWQVQQLVQALSSNQMKFLHQARDYIKQQFNIQYSLSGVHYILKRLNIQMKPRFNNTNLENNGAGMLIVEGAASAQ